MGIGLAVIASVMAGVVPVGAAEVPDGRGYELVSPSAKNGGDVMADASRTRASVSGDAVGFASLAAFGDILGTGVASEYVSQRTGQVGTQGWQTHSIIPTVNPLSANGVTHNKDTVYRGEFSDDLSTGVLESYTPLTNDPNVGNLSNLYLRPDLWSAGQGNYTLLDSCPACSGPFNDPRAVFEPWVAGATPDLGHVIFEANQALTSDALPEPAGCLLSNSCTPNLYEWDHGVLRLAGVLPNGSAAPSSIAGLGASTRSYTLNTISSDGSKVFFTVPDSPGDSQGDLYMRVNHASTVKLNASMRTDCADNGPSCSGTPEPDPAGAQPASYDVASADGSKVFFHTGEQLTDTPGSDLYVYDTNLPAGDPNHLRHVFNDQQPHDGIANFSGVLGASSDGSYVYFLDQSALLPGQPDLPFAAPLGIYVWHNGTINLVGSVADSGNTVSNGWPGLSSRVTPDGRTLLLRTQLGAGLTGYDHGSTCGAFGGNAACTELYRYRADSGQLTCVSCNPTGAKATADATFSVDVSTGAAQSSSHLNHPMTADGNHVFFETGERLLPDQDVNGKHSDVYEWTAQDAGGCTTTSPGFRASAHGCLALITPGTSSDDSHFLDADPNGNNVFFSTNQQLVGWDTDNNYDLYDARIGGGLPDPTPATPECAGQACHGLIPTPPPALSPSSSSLILGNGNVPPRTAHKKAAVKRCAKGKVRKRVHGKIRCVKKPKPKHKAKRAAHKHAT